MTFYKRNPNEFLRQFITMDETWVQHYISEIKKHWKHWTATGVPASIKQMQLYQLTRFQRVFFGMQWEILLLINLKTVKLLMVSGIVIRSFERRYLAIFHQLYAPAHSSIVATAKINELKFELLRHSTYSHDYTLCSLTWKIDLVDRDLRATRKLLVLWTDILRSSTFPFIKII